MKNRTIKMKKKTKIRHLQKLSTSKNFDSKNSIFSIKLFFFEYLLFMFFGKILFLKSYIQVILFSFICDSEKEKILCSL